MSGTNVRRALITATRLRHLKRKHPDRSAAESVRRVNSKVAGSTPSLPNASAETEFCGPETGGHSGAQRPESPAQRPFAPSSIQLSAGKCRGIQDRVDNGVSLRLRGGAKGNRTADLLCNPALRSELQRPVCRAFTCRRADLHPRALRRPKGVGGALRSDSGQAAQGTESATDVGLQRASAGVLG